MSPQSPGPRTPSSPLRHVPMVTVALLAGLLLAASLGTGRGPGAAPSSSAAPPGSIGPLRPSSALAAFAGFVVPGSDPILVGAADIATSPAGPNGSDQATALLLDAVVAANPGRVTVFAAGDLAYPNGSPADFAAYYDPTWGRHKAITRPVPGNHEYSTAAAAGYFNYFGAAAGDPAQGWYAYDLGTWRIYALNSEVAHGAGSAQERWLRADLGAHAGTACVAAYWHRPRFSSADHGSDLGMRALWQALQDAGAELVISGHDHDYQRFAPQTADGLRAQASGVRQWVVGTGGKDLYAIPAPIANMDAWSDATFGVLRLVLHPASYDFDFLPVAGGSYTDSGSNLACN